MTSENQTTPDNFSQVKELTASVFIEDCIEDYMNHLAVSKLASCIDGLKQVHRRILWALRKNNNLQTGITLIGPVIGLHPVGDNSIWDSMTRLAQPFSVGIPFMDNEGYVGGYSDPVAAAPRYLQLSTAEYIRDLLYNGVDFDTIPMQPTVDFSELEPKYFIPRLPTSLLLGSFTIGIGFAAQSCPLNIIDVCDAVQKYVDHKQNHPSEQVDFAKFAKHFVPDFPNKGYIRNRDILIDQYKEGNYNHPVFHDGSFRIEGQKLIFETIAYGGLYSQVLKLIEKLREDKNFWLHPYLQSFGNPDSDRTKGMFYLMFKRGVNIFDLLVRIRKSVGFSANVTPNPNYITPEQTIGRYPTPRLLEVWYWSRYQSITGGLKNDQRKHMRKLIELEAMMHVVDKQDEVIALARASTDQEDLINKYITAFGLTRYQAITLKSIKIERLGRSSHTQLIEEKNQVENHLKTTISNFSRVNEIIYGDAAMFKKKYKNPRHTSMSEYTGYVNIDNKGIIQFESDDEMFDILESNPYPNIKATIHKFGQNEQYHYSVKGNRVSVVKDRTSRIMLPHDIDLQHIVSVPFKQIYTLITENGNATCVEGVVADASKMHVYSYVPKGFMVVYRDGTVAPTTVDDVGAGVRKILSKGTTSDVMYGYSDVHDESVICHMSAGEPNILRLSRIQNKKGKIILVPKAEFRILGVVSSTCDEVMFNLPETYLNRLQAGYVCIRDIKSFFTGKSNNVMIDLNKSNSFPGKKIHKHHKCRMMLTL